MNILYVSKALGVAAHREKLVALARHVDVVGVMPDRWWPDPEMVAGDGAGVRAHSVWLPGRSHLHLYRHPARLFGEPQPDLVHVDEEPYSAVTFQLLRHCRRRRIPAVFFTWQNLDKRLPPPFALFRRFAFRHVAGAIAGTDAAAGVLRRQGYGGPVAVIPQFGVNPERFAPDPAARRRVRGRLGVTDEFVVGFAGRLVPEKGLAVLLAAARLTDVHVVIVGGSARRGARFALPAVGPGKGEGGAVKWEAWDRGRFHFAGRVPSLDIPRWLNAFDVLVLPSLSTRTWKEQFGRVLIEAMACGVPVVGSDSGEIPRVIGEAGLVVPEGDVAALAGALKQLATAPALRVELGQRGRRRVLERYTDQRVAQQTVAFYRLCVREAGRGTRETGSGKRGASSVKGEA